ncbi:hypothetical protein Tco_0954518 [Tanacetum coccineum]|uniref:Uncharacterized protein n=1 Tax=Tanacetum coccineum TaxID=301880 RepID=A0ABQ5E4L8_9ASTR
MTSTTVTSVEQAVREPEGGVSSTRLMFLVNQEIMEDALRVEDYKRMSRQLRESVRRKCGYIRALKVGPISVVASERLKFLERMRLEDMEKGTRLLLMMKETEELVSAAGSDATKDQLVVLFEREVAESLGKIEEYRRLCIELRANIRLRNDYICELQLYRSCDDVIGSIAMLRRMQLDDADNASRLLSLARETQQKVDEKTDFITRIRERLPGTAL